MKKDANKTDLRYVKTENLIRHVFLKLKENSTIVRIKDICEKALITRSTFYSHYKDVNALEDKVQSSYIESLLHENMVVESLLTDYRLGCQRIVSLYQQHSEEIYRLFDEDLSRIANALEDAIFRMTSVAEIAEKERIRLVFIVGGISSLIKCDKIKDIYFANELVLSAMLAGRNTEQNQITNINNTRKETI